MKQFSIEKLTIKKNKRYLVKDLFFTINEGEIWGVLGPNGIGKTTLLKAIALDESETQHSVFFCKEKLDSFSACQRAKIISFLEQEPKFLFAEPVLNVLKLAFYAKNIYDKQKMAEVLVQYDLVALQKKSILDLSVGERKRIALAMIKLQDTELIFLDEPTNHLDFKYQFSLLHYLYSPKKMILMSTHDLNLVERFCSHVLLLFPDGKWLAGTCLEMMEESLLTALYQHPLIAVQVENKKIWMHQQASQSSPTRGERHFR